MEQCIAKVGPVVYSVHGDDHTLPATQHTTAGGRGGQNTNGAFKNNKEAFFCNTVESTSGIVNASLSPQNTAGRRTRREVRQRAERAERAEPRLERCGRFITSLESHSTPMTSSSSSNTASEILGRIENDAVFRGFLEVGFDPAAFASKIVRADVGKAHASAAGTAGAAAGEGGIATPVLQLQQGGHGVGCSSSTGGGGGGGLMASAESVSSQAEITLDVSF